MTLPTTRQITDTAMAYGRLTGHIRAFLPVIALDAHGNVSGLNALKDAIEIIAQKRSTKELRKHDDEQENGKAKEAIKVLRQTLRRITRKDIEKGGLGLDITFNIKDGICNFYIHEAEELEESEARDILTTLAQKLDASEVPDSILEMIAEEMRKLSV